MRGKGLLRLVAIAGVAGLTACSTTTDTGGGAFSLNGAQHRVPINNNGNSLHGGTVGFDAKVWQATPQNTNDSVGLKLQYLSPAGEMGYPGALTTTVTYTTPDQRKLWMISGRRPIRLTNATGLRTLPEAGVPRRRTTSSATS